MEKDNKRKITPDINEGLMMDLMADGVKLEGLQVPPEIGEKPDNGPAKEDPGQEAVPEVTRVPPDKGRAKKTPVQSYGDAFLKRHSMTGRGEKSIYIRREYHERLMRIAQVIGKDEIPLYAYLDNILAHHFTLFEQPIKDEFNEKNGPIF